jgi:hypothetical protein
LYFDDVRLINPSQNFLKPDSTGIVSYAPFPHSRLFSAFHLTATYSNVSQGWAQASERVRPPTRTLQFPPRAPLLLRYLLLLFLSLFPFSEVDH